MIEFVRRDERTNERGHVIVTVVDERLRIHRVTIPPHLVGTSVADDVVREVIAQRRLTAGETGDG